MRTIKQKVKFNAKPHEVYELLMNSKKHSAFTCDEAKISRKIGGKISAYGNYIEGENLELIKDKDPLSHPYKKGLKHHWLESQFDYLQLQQ